MEILSEDSKKPREEIEKIKRDDGSVVNLKIVYEIDETTEGPISAIYEYNDGRKSKVIANDLVDMTDCSILLGGDIITAIEDRTISEDKIPDLIRFKKTEDETPGLFNFPHNK